MHEFKELLKLKNKSINKQKKRKWLSRRVKKQDLVIEGEPFAKRGFGLLNISIIDNALLAVERRGLHHHLAAEGVSVNFPRGGGGVTDGYISVVVVGESAPRRRPAASHDRRGALSEREIHVERMWMAGMLEIQERECCDRGMRLGFVDLV